MDVYRYAWVAEAAKEIEKVLTVMSQHYLEWSERETECSILSCLVRVDSAEQFQKKIKALVDAMDNHFECIKYCLKYYLLSTIRVLELKFPMTPAGIAAVQGRDYPALENACQDFWNSKLSIIVTMTNRAKSILPEIPSDRARVERLDKTLPGYQRLYQEVVMSCNAPVDKMEEAEFKLEFHELMVDVKALLHGRAPRFTWHVGFPDPETWHIRGSVFAYFFLTIDISLNISSDWGTDLRYKVKARV